MVKVFLVGTSPSIAVAFPVAQIKSPTNSNCNVQRVDFLKPSAIQELGFDLDAIGVNAKLTFLAEDGKTKDDGCSSTVVSDDGVIVTAGHCLIACLSRSNIYEKIDNQNLIKKDKLDGLKCEVLVNGIKVPYEILATNDCAAESLLNKDNPRGRCQGLDYAIIKVDAKQANLRRCGKLGEPYIGQNIFHIGSGKETSRNNPAAIDDNNSDGSVALTRGQTILPQDTCIWKHTTTKKSFFGEPTFPFVEEKTKLRSKFIRENILKEAASGNLIQTTADSIAGFSGGGFFDASTGHLVGIMSVNDPRNWEGEECVGATFFVNIAKVLADIKLSYPKFDFEKSFRCEANAVRPRK